MNNIPAPLIFILGCCLVFGKNRSWKLLKIFGTNIIAAQEHSLFVDKTSIGFFRVMENGCLLGHDFLGIGSIFLLYLSWLMYKFQFYLPPTSITIICNLFQEGGPISLVAVSVLKFYQRRETTNILNSFLDYFRLFAHYPPVVVCMLSNGEETYFTC